MVAFQGSVRVACTRPIVDVQCLNEQFYVLRRTALATLSVRNVSSCFFLKMSEAKSPKAR